MANLFVNLLEGTTKDVDNCMAKERFVFPANILNDRINQI